MTRATPSVKHVPDGQIFPNLREIKVPSDASGEDHGEHKQKGLGIDGEATDQIQKSIARIQKEIGSIYEPHLESIPDLPVYRPGFAKVVSLCETMYEQAAGVFESSGYCDEWTRGLLRSIHNSKSPQYGEAKKIAFYGDSGVGKSSLINALLNSPDLTAKGSNGSACTCVITEFRNAPDSQKSPILAEIEFYGIKEIGVMLGEYYAHYYHFYVEGTPDLEGDELEVVETEATTAGDVFEALFANRPEFQSGEQLTNFLNSGGSDKDEKILQKLLKWASEMISSQCKAGEKVPISATNTDDLSRALEPFVEMKTKIDGEDGSSASYWPLIRLVHVSLHSPLLARGLIIADLPGLSDTNKARQRTTTHYLRLCACTIIVAPIQRVMTSESVHRKLLDTMSRPRKTRLLICTMIDVKDLDADTTKARTVVTNVADLERHNELFDVYKARKKENLKNNARMRKMEGKERQEALQQGAMDREQEQILQSMVLESLVIMRNAKINHTIHEKYERINQNARTLVVCFVSSRDYEYHTQGSTSASNIPLPVASTGVPRLRYQLSSLPADDRMTVLDLYYKHTLRSLLDTMSIWVSQSPLERQQHLRRVVEKPQQVFATSLKMLFDGLSSDLSEKILDPIFNDSLLGWSKCGVEKCESWMKIHPSSIAALCRKEGAHKAKGKPFRDWNQELLEAVNITLMKLRKSWEPSMKVRIKIFSDEIHHLLDVMRKDLNDTPGVSVLPMAPFLKSLSTKKELLANEVHKFSNNMGDANATTFETATSSDHDSAIMEAMMPVYEKLKPLKGKSKTNERKKILMEAIQMGKPFRGIHQGIHNCFKQCFQEQERALSDNIKIILDDMLNDFDLSSIQDETPDKRRDDLKGEIKQFLVEAEKRYHGPIATEFAKLLQR